MFEIIFAAFCLLGLEITGVAALTNVHIRIPEAVRMGDTVTLACDYDLEKAALYTIKWYKEDAEFYRFVPKESPPSRVFLVPSVSVDVSRSDSRKVTLTNVDKDTSGYFKCEVSADAPLFHTEIRSAHLHVADIPSDGPILETRLQKVEPGAKITANCTSPASRPPMNITWFLNDVEIRPSPDIQIQKMITKHEIYSDLKRVQSIIHIRANSNLFTNNKIKLRCLATMFTLYRQAAELDVEEDTPLLALMMATKSPKHTSAESGTSPLRGSLGSLALSPILAMFRIKINLCVT